MLNSAPHAAAYRPGKGRALAAGLIDLVIIMATLGVGWLILLNFTAPSSETPGGQIAGLRVYRLDGQPASRARVNALGLYELVIALDLGLVTAGVLTLINYFWVLGANGQALHDVAAKTILVRVDEA